MRKRGMCADHCRDLGIFFDLELILKYTQRLTGGKLGKKVAEPVERALRCKKIYASGISDEKREMMGDEDVKKGKHTTDLISFVETPRSLFMVFHIHRFCLSNPYLSVPPHPPLPASSLMEKKMFSMLHDGKKVERRFRISKFMDDNRINNRSYVIARRKNIQQLFLSISMNEARSVEFPFMCGRARSGWNVMTVFKDAKWIMEAGKRMRMEEFFVSG
jgi:hypothetical protein